MKPGSVRARLGALLDGNYLFDNTPAMQRFSVTLYRRLAEGTPVPPDALAAVMAVPPGEVAALLGGLPATAIEFDEAKFRSWPGRGPTHEFLPIAAGHKLAGERNRMRFRDTEL